MLVLTRKSQQSIRIGPDITVTVLSVEGGTVRIGVQAPRSISIERDDIKNDKPANGNRL